MLESMPPTSGDGPAPDVVAALTRSIQTGAESLRAALEQGSLKLGVKRVHVLRVALRRLLSTCELVTVVGCEVSPRLPRRLARLLRQLSPLRDVQVQLRALAGLALVQGVETNRLSARLRRQQRALMHKAGRSVTKFDVEVFEHEIRAAIEALSAIASDAPTRAAVEAATRGQLARLHLGVDVRRRALLRASARARVLHRLRLHLKEYRYSLEVIAPTLPPKVRELALTAARLQEALGSAHDAHLLATMFRAELERRGTHPRFEELCSKLARDSDAAQLAATTLLADTQLDWPLP